MIIIGIRPGLTVSAYAIYDGEFIVDNGIVTSNDGEPGSFPLIHNEMRYRKMYADLMSIIKPAKPDIIRIADWDGNSAIHGYQRGRLIGMLHSYCLENNIEFRTILPSEVKRKLSEKMAGIGFLKLSDREIEAIDIALM